MPRRLLLIVLFVFTMCSPATAWASTPIAGETIEPQAVTYESVEGNSRYDTAVAASQVAFPSGLIIPDREGFKTAVIATGSDWPDALGGSALAGLVNGPILLTRPDALPSVVSTELTRLGATRVFLLGGIGAVSEVVEAQLAADYTVERIWGKRRYETALAIAQRIDDMQMEGYMGGAFISTGQDFPDALAASPLAARFAYPIFLVGPSGFDESTETLMQEMVGHSVVVLGGEGAVAAEVETKLESAFGASEVTRLGGANRYDTAAKVAEYGVANFSLSWDGVGISTGQSFPDALAGGVMCRQVRTVLLLAQRDALPAATSASLSSNSLSINKVHFLGGTGALGATVRDDVRAILD